MARRVIQECDLTKQEYDPDETVKVTIKKKGKGTGRTYELSPGAASKLEQQLVAGQEAQLPEDWRFGYSEPDAEPEEPTSRTLGDLDVDSDERMVAEKRSELREAGVLEEDREDPTDPVVAQELVTARNDNGCIHMNKGKILTTLREGKRFVYRKCTSCRAEVPEMTADQRKDYMSGKVDSDVRVKSS